MTSPYAKILDLLRQLMAEGEAARELRAPDVLETRQKLKRARERLGIVRR